MKRELELHQAMKNIQEILSLLPTRCCMKYQTSSDRIETRFPRTTENPPFVQSTSARRTSCFLALLSKASFPRASPGIKTIGEMSTETVYFGNSRKLSRAWIESYRGLSVLAVVGRAEPMEKVFFAERRDSVKHTPRNYAPGESNGVSSRKLSRLPLEIVSRAYLANGNAIRNSRLTWPTRIVVIVTLMQLEHEPIAVRAMYINVFVNTTLSLANSVFTCSFLLTRIVVLFLRGLFHLM